MVLLTAVTALAEAGATTDKVKSLDADWDEEQRTFDIELQLKDRKKQPAPVRAAAARVRVALLSEGTDQVNYSYDKEVEFGRKQVLTAETKELKADLTLQLGGVDGDQHDHRGARHGHRLRRSQQVDAASLRAACSPRSAARPPHATPRTTPSPSSSTAPSPGRPAPPRSTRSGTLVHALLARREAAPAAVKTQDAPAPVMPPLAPPDAAPYEPVSR